MLLEIKDIKIGKIILNKKINFTGINCIVGENGIGKSSILRVLSAMYLPSNGCLIVDKKKYDLSNNIEKSSWRKISREKIFYLDDDNIFLNENTTVEQNYKYFMLINNIDYEKREDRFIELYNRFKIKDDLSTEIRHLSSGTKKKIVIIFTLMIDRENVLLDEPLNHLDKEAKEMFYELIVESKKNVLFTSHDHLSIKKHNVNIIELR